MPAVFACGSSGAFYSSVLREPRGQVIQPVRLGFQEVSSRPGNERHSDVDLIVVVDSGGRSRSSPSTVRSMIEDDAYRKKYRLQPHLAPIGRAPPPPSKSEQGAALLLYGDRFRGTQRYPEPSAPLARPVSY
jgi:hypothetical protein